MIPDEAARSLADERGVEIRRYDIIYKVTEDIESHARRQAEAGRTGRRSRSCIGAADCLRSVVSVRSPVAESWLATIERGCRIRVNRDGRGIGDYPLDSLRREKDDAKEVREGFECGIKLSGFNDLKEGDILEAYKIEEVARTL